MLFSQKFKVLKFKIWFKNNKHILFIIIIVLCSKFQLLMKAGSEGKPIVFLFADTQIKSESFMEDISMILNTGDVPNLFASDEKAELIEKMQAIARNEVTAIT